MSLELISWITNWAQLTKIDELIFIYKKLGEPLGLESCAHHSDD